jgi:hypothetical protein
VEPRGGQQADDGAGDALGCLRQTAVFGERGIRQHLEPTRGTLQKAALVTARQLGARDAFRVKVARPQNAD